MPDQPRPVWLTREQRDWLERHANPVEREVVAAWDAAPADPHDVIAMAYTGWNTGRLGVTLPEAVLRALGCPDV